MSRPKGLPKSGGRIRGTPNKKTGEIAKKLRKLGCDPIEGLAKIALDPESKPELKVRCLAELAQYLYPKRKPVDPVTPEGSEFKLTVEHIGSRLNLSDSPSRPSALTAAQRSVPLTSPAFGSE